MPRLTQGMPKYRKHRASGQAVVTIQGRDHYLGPYGTAVSKAEYNRIAGEWIAQGRPAAAPSPPEAVSVSEILAAFWRHAKRYYVKNGRPTGTAETFRPVISLVKTSYGPTPAMNFGPLAVKAIVARMIAEGQSRRYINDTTNKIKHIFRWAVSEQLVSPLTHQAIATVAGLREGHSQARETEKIGPVSDAIVEKTLPHLPAVIQALVQLQRLTGARPSEVCQIRPCDIDRSQKVWRYTPASHKTQHHGKSRQIFIGPKAQAILKPYLDREPTANCFSPSESRAVQQRKRTAKRVTPANAGNKVGEVKKRWPKWKAGDAFTTDSYRRAITRGCEVAFNMPPELRRKRPGETPEGQRVREAKASAWREKHCWAPNRLRHSAASEIRRRYGLEHAQVLLGHAEADMTQRYAEKDAEKARKVAWEIG